MAEAVHPLIDIEVRSKGIEAVQKSLDQLVSSEEELIQATERVVKVRERNEATIERLARKYDLEYRATRQLEQAQKELDRAKAAGLAGTQAFERAVAGVQKAHIASSSAMNDNATAIGLNRMQMLESIHVGKSFVDMIIAGASPLRALALEGGRIAQIFTSGQGGVAGTLQAFGSIAVRALASPIGIAAQLTAAIAAAGIAADRAQSQLAKLGETSRATGLSAEQIQGAKIVGAGAGLDERGALSAFSNASAQFEAFSRNEGAVKGALDKIDAGFLKVADRARTAGEFIDLIEKKIRDLPRSEGLNLAQSLFGEDAGRRLYDSIESGAASMRGLAEATGRTGDKLDQAAKSAEEAQRQIDQAAAVASDKLLKAFQDLGDPVSAIKIGWYEIVGSIAQAVSESQNLQSFLRGFAHPIDTVRELVTGEQQFRGRFIPLSESGIVQPTPVGVSRQGYEARAEAAKAAKRSHASEQSDAFRYSETLKDLQTRIDLARAEGVEYDRLERLQRVQNEQRRLGVKATQEQKDAVGDLAGKLSDAEHEAKRYNDAIQEVASIGKDVFSGMISSLREGKSVGETFLSTLNKIADRLTSMALDAAFGSIGGMGRGSSSSGLGGLLSGLAGSIFGGGSATAAPFADGGIVGAAGGRRMTVPASAFIGAPHFAGGGAVPVIAHAGEVILNAAQQRNVAAALAAGRGSGNDNRGGDTASPVTVNLIGAPQGTKVQETRDQSGGRRIDVVMDERIAAAMGSPQGAESARANYGMTRQVARR